VRYDFDSRGRCISSDELGGGVSAFASTASIDPQYCVGARHAEILADHRDKGTPAAACEARENGSDLDHRFERAFAIKAESLGRQVGILGSVADVHLASMFAGAAWKQVSS
jgi:hypothetical protein